MYADVVPHRPFLLWRYGKLPPYRQSDAPAVYLNAYLAHDRRRGSALQSALLAYGAHINRRSLSGHRFYGQKTTSDPPAVRSDLPALYRRFASHRRGKNVATAAQCADGG